MRAAAHDGSTELIPCSFGRRVAAFAIDQAIAWGVVLVCFGIAVGASGVDLEEEPLPGSRDEQVLEALVLLAAIVPFGYFWIWNGLGYSPGKQMLGLKIVNEEGVAPGLVGGFSRTVGSIMTPLFAMPCVALLANEQSLPSALLLTLPLLLALPAIPYLWAAWDASATRPLARGRRQAWHDKVSGTQVVRARRP